MRHFLLLAIFLFSFFNAKSQCVDAVLDDWSHDNGIYTFSFTMPDDPWYVESAEFTFAKLYGFGSPVTYVISTPVVSGLNVIEFEIADLFYGAYYLPHQYYRVDFEIICSTTDLSEPSAFYISPFSLLNDPFFEMPEYFEMPLSYFGGEDANVSLSQITVQDGPNTGEINDLDLFLDIGHTQLSDLSISLVSPVGTIVEVLSYPNGLIGYQGLSAIFSDEASFALGNDPEAQGYYIPAESFATFDGELAAGVWEVIIEDFSSLDSGMVAGVGLSFNSAPCEASVAGTAFYDMNSNGVFDSDENGLSYALISNSLEGSTTASNTNGDYWDCTLIGSGSEEVLNLPLYFETNPVAFETSESEPALTDYHLPVTPISGISDLSIDVFNASQYLTLWFGNNYYVQYSNVGTECIADIEVTIDFEPGIEVLSVSDVLAEISGNDVVLAIPELCPGESGGFMVYVGLEESVVLGDVFTTTASINPSAEDETPENNQVSMEEVVLSGYDPNDKSVSHEVIFEDFVPNNETLDYLVRFQNTGNFMAGRVVVVDSISEFLDLSTLQILSASHDMELTLEDRVLYFEFDDIMLPDSTSDEAGSHGFVKYQIQPVDDLLIGDIILNTANIYFDFNEPIITNTTFTQLVVTPGVGEVGFEANLYPNPGKSFVRVSWLREAQVEAIHVFDLKGKKLFVKQVNGVTNTTLDFSRFEQGAYIVQFSGKQSMQPVVWMKL